jgi:eukaryotic-like serine/threonine-protein kinase
VTDRIAEKTTISKEFGRYELLLEMAKGGMATLFLARLSGPKKFEKLVAVKRIHDLYSDEDLFTSMFLDEARLTARIHHPNVATVFDMGEEDGHYYIAMEYVHGLDLNKILRAAIRQKRPLEWQQVARLVADAAAGLHAAHELRDNDGQPMGVVHRDVSPQNILVSFDGHVKVVDFGIAFAAERLTNTATGTLKGKAAYMSPEQVSGKTLDRRSDVFSLGILLWESVLLRRLFREDNDATTILRIVKGDIPHPRSIRPDLPESLVKIMMRALAQEPEDRYQTAGELEEALNRELMRHDAYVAASHISEMMTGLFYDKKQMMDEQMQRALETPSEEPMRAIGVDSASSTENSVFSMSAISGWNRKGGVSRGGWVGIAIGLVLVGVVLYFVFQPRGSSESASGAKTAQGAMTTPAPKHGDKAAPVPMASRARPVAPRARPPAMRPRRVSIRLTLLPANSAPVVTFQGKEYPGRKFQRTVTATSDKVPLVIRAPGFLERRLELALKDDILQTVRLKPERRRPTTKVRRRFRRRRGPHRKPPRRHTADLVKTF